MRYQFIRKVLEHSISPQASKVKNNGGEREAVSHKYEKHIPAFSGNVPDKLCICFSDFWCLCFDKDQVLVRM